MAAILARLRAQLLEASDLLLPLLLLLNVAGGAVPGPANAVVAAAALRSSRHKEAQRSVQEIPGRTNGSPKAIGSRKRRIE